MAGLDDFTVNSLIVAPCLLGLVYSVKQWKAVSDVKIDGTRA